MNRLRRKSVFVTCFTGLLLAGAAAAQTAPPEPAMSSASRWFALLELPFLFACVIFAFLSARALRGGVFGRGMALMAWGFLVMGVGHLHMQLEIHFGFSLFDQLLGAQGGRFAWFVALMATWALSGLGFHNIYRASRGV